MIPKSLLEMADSKKAVTFWVVFIMWLPMIREATGFDEVALQWLTIAYVGYAISQGLSDFGKNSECGCMCMEEERGAEGTD